MYQDSSTNLLQILLGIDGVNSVKGESKKGL